ncbi:CUB and sushi domain-containing protein 2-like [Branchiostoma lanceolatum]|uniref:CUB and sushi domain-containing protein 2-like n=1 Tax=Branchiostoma lanceolatum TaxID=7740 RepID=UPI0034534D3B
MGSNITVESCIERCRNQGSSIAALNRQNCICGSGVNHNSHAPEFCTTQCRGNSDQTCGDPGRADVYQTWVGACGYRETTGAIYSPMYPGTYPYNDNCTWEINFDPDKVIKFYYNVWDVPAGDTLVITDRSGQSRTLGPDFDTAWTNEVTVNFVSNGRVNGRFAVHYEAVDHCGGIGTTGGVAQISPSHGGNFAVGQQVTIRCTDGTETVVECLQDKIFNVTGPYCTGQSIIIVNNDYSLLSSFFPSIGTSPTVVFVIVSVLAVLVLLAILFVAVLFVIKKRTTQEPRTSSDHEYETVDQGTSNDEYEMMDTQQDPHPPVRGPQAPATVLPLPGVSNQITQSDYQALNPRTMCKNSADDHEYQNTFGKIYENA